MERTGHWSTMTVPLNLFLSIGMPKLILMKKNWLLVLLFVNLSAYAWGQIRSSAVQIAHGRCVAILKQFTDTTRCDSAAIQLFLQRYYFDSGVYFPASKWKEANEFINKKENVDLTCTFKALRREQDLIDNTKKK